MRAEVISISAVTRAARQDWREEAVLEGFTKALGVVHSLNAASMAESKLALEHWVQCGKLTSLQRSALVQFYGWESA